MLKSLLGVLLGLLLGATFGAIVAYMMSRAEDSSSGWVNYPTIADRVPGTAVVRQHLYSFLPRQQALFFGYLVGGGFSAVAGAIVGAASAVVVTKKEHRQSP